MGDELGTRLLYQVRRPDGGECPLYPLQGSLTATNRRIAGQARSYGWCWYNPVYQQPSTDLHADELDELLPYRAMSPLTMHDVGLAMGSYDFVPLNDFIRRSHDEDELLRDLYQDPFPQALVLLLNTAASQDAQPLSFVSSPPLSVHHNSSKSTEFVGPNVDIAAFSVLHVYHKLAEQMWFWKDEEFVSGFAADRAPDGVAILPLLTKSGSDDARDLAPPRGLVKVWEMGTMDMASLEARGLSLNQCVSLARPVATPAPVKADKVGRQRGALEANFGVDCALSTLGSHLALEIAVSGFTMCPLVINPVVTKNRAKRSGFQDLLSDELSESADGDYPFSLHSIIEAIDCKLLSSGLEEEFFQGTGGISLQSDNPGNGNKSAFNWGGTEQAQKASQAFVNTMGLRAVAIHRTFPYAPHDGSFARLNSKTWGTPQSRAGREAGSKVGIASHQGPRVYPAAAELPSLKDADINFPPNVDRYHSDGLKRYGSRQGVIVPPSRWQVWPHVVATRQRAKVTNLVDKWDAIEIGVAQQTLDLQLFKSKAKLRARVNPDFNQAKDGDAPNRKLFTRPSKSSEDLDDPCYRMHLHWDGTTAAPMGRTVDARLPQPLASDPFVARNTIVQQLASTVALLNSLRREKLEHVFSDLSGEIYACTDAWFTDHVKLYAMGDIAFGSTNDTAVFDTCYLRSGRVAQAATVEPLEQPLTGDIAAKLPAMYCGCMEYMPRGDTKPDPAKAAACEVDWEEPSIGNSVPWYWQVQLETKTSYGSPNLVTVSRPPAGTGDDCSGELLGAEDSPASNGNCVVKAGLPGVYSEVCNGEAEKRCVQTFGKTCAWQPMCSDYTCSRGLKLIDDAATTQGADDKTCCEPEPPPAEPEPPPAEPEPAADEPEPAADEPEPAPIMQSCVLKSATESLTVSVDLHGYQAPRLTLSAGCSTYTSDALFGLTTAVTALAGQYFYEDTTGDSYTVSLCVRCDPYPADNLTVGQLGPFQFRCHPSAPLRQLTPLLWTGSSAVARMSIRAMDPHPQGSPVALKAQNTAFLPDLQFGVVGSGKDREDAVHTLPVMTQALTRGCDTAQVHGMLVYLPKQWGGNNILGTQGDMQKNTIVACRAAPPCLAASRRGTRANVGAVPDDMIGQVAALTTGLLMIALALGVA